MSQELQQRNNRVLVGCLLGVAGMIGLSFASVPLYDWFCRVTGFAGTTQVSVAAPGSISDRQITILFDASINPKLPWTFYPEQRRITLPIGETGLAFYRAESRTKQDTVGTATFNVTPLKAGQYFAKTQCFCFTEQMLTAGESIQMPVSFYVDPAILEDPGMADVDTITLSYTFFRMDENGDAIQMDAAAADLDPFLTVN